MKTKSDTIQHDRRKHAVMLDRSRHDLLSNITPKSVPAFSWVYAEMEAVNAIHPGLGDRIEATLDTTLQLSASVKGWRANQIENVLKGSEEDAESLGRDIEVPRGLRDR